MRLDKRVDAETLQRQLGSWRGSTGNLAEALAEQIRRLVVDGRLQANVRLPAERRLADILGMSRTTVAAAYDHLRGRGYLESRQGAGSWTAMPSAPTAQRAAPWLPGGVESPVDLSHAALPAPLEAVADAVAWATAEYPRHLDGHGYEMYGLPVLRDAIARRFCERGLPTTAEMVLVTNGAQQALNLALEEFVQPGGRVMVDHPTYPGALDALRRHGARPVPIGFDDDVWHLETVRHTARAAAPQMMYAVTDCHNPTGRTLPDASRQALVETLGRAGIPLVVDETLAELVLDGVPALPIAAQAGASRATIVTIGSMSKAYWGGLRVGWLRAPAAMVRRFAGIRAVMDMAGPIFDQLVAARMLSAHGDVVDQRRTELAVARDHLLYRIGLDLPTWSVDSVTGGLNLWVDLGRPVGEALARAAAHAGIQLTPGPRFGVEGAFERFVRIPFTLRRQDAEAAIGGLTSVWETFERRGRQAG